MCFQAHRLTFCVCYALHTQRLNISSSRDVLPPLITDLTKMCTPEAVQEIQMSLAIDGECCLTGQSRRDCSWYEQVCLLLTLLVMLTFACFPVVHCR